MYGHLPKKEKTIHIDLVGNDTFVAYKGDFTVLAKLDMKGKHALALEKTRLMADYANPSSDLRGIAITLATIRARIVKAPDWWYKLDAASEMMDENVLLAIYDGIIDAEKEWSDAVKKMAEDSKKEQKAEDKAKEENSGN